MLAIYVYISLFYTWSPMTSYTQRRDGRSMYHLKHPVCHRELALYTLGNTEQWHSVAFWNISLRTLINSAVSPTLDADVPKSHLSLDTCDALGNEASVQFRPWRGNPALEDCLWKHLCSPRPSSKLQSADLDSPLRILNLLGETGFILPSPAFLTYFSFQVVGDIYEDISQDSFPWIH